MKPLFTCVGIAALLICSPAMTQTISGKYIMTIHVVCQPTVTFNFGNVSGVGNYVNSVALGPSDVVNNMFLATFNPTKHTVSFTGFEDKGDVLLVQKTGAVTGNAGFPLPGESVVGKIELFKYEHHCHDKWSDLQRAFRTGG